MTPSSSRLPVSSRAASLQPVRKPGSMASTRGRAAAAASSLLRRLRAKTSTAWSSARCVSSRRISRSRLGTSSRARASSVGLLEELGVRVLVQRLRRARPAAPGAAVRGGWCGAAEAARSRGGGRRGVRRRRRPAAGDAFGGRRASAAGGAADAPASRRRRRRRRRGGRRFAGQRQRQTLQGDAPAGLGVPLQLDLQGVFLLAAVDGQDAVRRDVADRLGELEVILVLQPLPFGEFLALGRAQLARVPQDGADARRGRRPSRRSSRPGCAARRPARPPACSAPSRG